MEQNKNNRRKTTRRLKAEQGVNVLAQFTHTIDKMDVPSLTELMIQTVHQEFGVESLRLFLHDGRQMKQYAALGGGKKIDCIKTSSAARKVLGATRGPITRTELNKDSALREIAAAFKEYSPSLIFPLVHRDDLIGMCVLGAPGSRGPLSVDERNLLTAMGKHASLAIGSLQSQKKARDATRMLKKATMEKQAYDEHKEDFVRITCHEFNTPLTIITLTANMLLSGDEGELTKGQRELVDHIVQNSARLSEINSDLLYLAQRGLVGRDSRKLCFFEEIFMHVMERVGILFGKRPELEAHIEIEEGMPPFLATPHDLSRALVNVIHNAIRFTPDEKGRIEINAFCEKDMIVCRVSDNGIGIEKKYHETVFEPFVELIDKLKRSSSPSRFRSSGLGLGLSIARDIVEKHGGEISLSSEGNGKGTTVQISLPTAK